MSQVGSESEEARRFLISGRVQGVFFRASTARMAGELGLRGYARNLADGRVEVLAVGTPSAVSKLAAWLRGGPPLARVAEISESNEPVVAHVGLQDFRSA
ncbi:MAG: acylphosphatase [Gammaproteobacteria bacterium]